MVGGTARCAWIDPFASAIGVLSSPTRMGAPEKPAVLVPIPVESSIQEAVLFLFRAEEASRDSHGVPRNR